jgi:hypothetical protein
LTDIKAVKAETHGRHMDNPNGSAVLIRQDHVLRTNPDWILSPDLQADEKRPASGRASKSVVKFEEGGSYHMVQA